MRKVIVKSKLSNNKIWRRKIIVHLSSFNSKTIVDSKSHFDCQENRMNKHSMIIITRIHNYLLYPTFTCIKLSLVPSCHWYRTVTWSRLSLVPRSTWSTFWTDELISWAPTRSTLHLVQRSTLSNAPTRLSLSRRGLVVSRCCCHTYPIVQPVPRTNLWKQTDEEI